jgi:hypothetical protein
MYQMGSQQGKSPSFSYYKQNYSIVKAGITAQLVCNKSASSNQQAH